VTGCGLATAVPDATPLSDAGGGMKGPDSHPRARGDWARSAAGPCGRSRSRTECLATPSRFQRAPLTVRADLPKRETSFPQPEPVGAQRLTARSCDTEPSPRRIAEYSKLKALPSFRFRGGPGHPSRFTIQVESFLDAQRKTDDSNARSRRPVPLSRRSWQPWPVHLPRNVEDSDLTSCGAHGLADRLSTLTDSHSKRYSQPL